MTERLLVVGGDAGGMSAASQARRRRAADELEIVAFERSEFTSTAACGIPYLVGGQVPDSDALIARTPDEHRAMGVQVHTGHEVLSIDLDARQVQVRDLANGADRGESFDQLVIATGATPTRPPIPGIDAVGVYGVQHHGDGMVLRDVAERAEARRVVVVGGGYVGIEMAEAFVNRGLEVALVDAAPQPMSNFDPDMGELVADAMRGLGIDLHLGERVEAFETSDGRLRAVVTEHRSLPADLVVLGLGVKPASDLARVAGIEIGPTGGIVADDRMRTSAPGVFAAGDCVETFHRVSRARVAIALGTHANKQGRVVGINATGGSAVFPGVIGTAVSKLCAYEVARTGLGEAEARDAGFDAFSVAIDSQTRAGYYPGASPIRVKVIVEHATGRLLGAQIIGKEGAAKRIDVLAVCIWQEMGVEEIQSLDLAYAPPFAPVWDPVLSAARVAAREL